MALDLIVQHVHSQLEKVRSPPVVLIWIFMTLLNVCLVPPHGYEAFYFIEKFLPQQHVVFKTNLES